MKKSFLLGIFLGAALTTITFVVSSEVTATLDPVKISPQYYKVLFENDQVRVLEYQLKAGEKEKMHTHPAGVVYSLGEGQIKSTLQDGQSREASTKAGEVHWRDPITHSIENIGTTELHALAVELKKQCN